MYLKFNDGLKVTLLVLIVTIVIYLITIYFG